LTAASTTAASCAVGAYLKIGSKPHRHQVASQASQTLYSEREAVAELRAPLKNVTKGSIRRRAPAQSTAPIEYLEKTEIEVLLAGISRATPCGQRDYAMFSLMFNTGARVQEILNLRVRDVRLEPPHQVRLLGKGNKVRICPIWPRTARLLKDLIQSRGAPENLADQPVFLNSRGLAMTRFGVRYLLQKYVAAGVKEAPTLADKRIHPHSIRHTTAVFLLKAGVDFATISQWLGHASLNTTMRYARADIELKRQALAQVFPQILAPPKGGAFVFHGNDLTGWLRRL
jgi:integrase/recombinase XerD